MSRNTDTKPLAALGANALRTAAERVFAERGFYGATIRDIADEAGVNLSLVSYHFGGKEALFQHVIEYRLDELIGALERAFANIPEPTDQRAVISAFVDVMLVKARDFKSGWGYYLQLIARSMSPYHVSKLRPSLTSLTRIGDTLHKALSPLNARGTNAHSAALGLYFMEAAVAYVIQDEWVLKQRLAKTGRPKPTAPQIRQKLVDFLYHGYQAALAPEQ
jgi:AcrR family transcriptional regulator